MKNHLIDQKYPSLRQLLPNDLHGVDRAWPLVQQQPNLQH